MTLSQIKEAIAAGKIVHWCNDNYQVIKHKVFEDHYLIRCTLTNHCIGLERNGKLHDDEKEFYVNDTK